MSSVHFLESIFETTSTLLLLLLLLLLWLAINEKCGSDTVSTPVVSEESKTRRNKMAAAVFLATPDTLVLWARDLPLAVRIGPKKKTLFYLLL